MSERAMARGGVAESVDARDLKSFGQKCLWGFKSPRPHQSRRGLNRSQIPEIRAENRRGPDIPDSIQCVFEVLKRC